MRCDGCKRDVLVSWALDGTAARFCCTCIRRALREADWTITQARLRAFLRQQQP